VDFGQVEAFVQVAAHRSFSRAAEVLQLTQPSITARIQSLERELSEELFERGGRGVRMTDAGLAFLPFAERILQTLQEGREAVDEVRNVQLGSLRVGSALTISTYVLPKILHIFRQRYAGVDVVIRTGRSEQVLTMLLNDEVQVGLVRSLTHQEVEAVHLYDDEIVLAAYPEHPFAATGRATVEDTASQPIILFDRDVVSGHLDALRRARRGEVLARIRVDDFLERGLDVVFGERHNEGSCRPRKSSRVGFAPYPR